MDQIYEQAIDTILKTGGVATLLVVAIVYLWKELGKVKAELKEERQERKDERAKHERALELRRRGELRRERRNNRTLTAIAELAPDPEDEEPDPDEVDEEDGV